MRFRRFRDIEERREKRRTKAHSILKSVISFRWFLAMFRRSRNIHPFIAIIITIFLLMVIFNFHAGMRISSITVSDRNIEKTIMGWNGRANSIRFLELGLFYAIFLKLVYINIKYYPPITGIINKGEAL